MEPKYTLIMSTLQDRIDRGILPVGTLLPSEAELTAEFGTSRSTVVRALRQLRSQGWVKGMQGKGRLILGRPARTLSTLPRRIQYLLQADRHAEYLGSRDLAAPPQMAAILRVPPGTHIYGARYRLSLLNNTPLALTTAFTPYCLTRERYLLDELESVYGRRAHHVTERWGARLLTLNEAEALSLTKRRSVAVALLTVHDAGGIPFLAVNAVLSREAPELSETYDI
ncbi:GntR family transcriptional regulator [Dactylosporangium sp. CS-033363]|uniref:GntR family transcriptional regulator n=1 Tax=Dactylosporangium sp. CS-033363 TaxID=3239935 RepID=UPI003D936B73